MRLNNPVQVVAPWYERSLADRSGDNLVTVDQTGDATALDYTVPVNKRAFLSSVSYEIQALDTLSSGDSLEFNLRVTTAAGATEVEHLHTELSDDSVVAGQASPMLYLDAGDTVVVEYRISGSDPWYSARTSWFIQEFDP